MDHQSLANSDDRRSKKLAGKITMLGCGKIISENLIDHLIFTSSIDPQMRINLNNCLRKRPHRSSSGLVNMFNKISSKTFAKFYLLFNSFGKGITVLIGFSDGIFQ